jgi:hypothetical protein
MTLCNRSSIVPSIDRYQKRPSSPAHAGTQTRVTIRIQIVMIAIDDMPSHVMR